MGTAARMVLTDNATRGLTSGGKVALYNDDGECPECCGCDCPNAITITGMSTGDPDVDCTKFNGSSAITWEVVPLPGVGKTFRYFPDEQPTDFDPPDVYFIDLFCVVATGGHIVMAQLWDDTFVMVGVFESGVYDCTDKGFDWGDVEFTFSDPGGVGCDDTGTVTLS